MKYFVKNLCPQNTIYTQKPLTKTQDIDIIVFANTKFEKRKEKK